MKVRTISIGKTRLVRSGNLQTWIKAEIQTEFETAPTLEDIDEVLLDINTILDKEEKEEVERWALMKAKKI